MKNSSSVTVSAAILAAGALHAFAPTAPPIQQEPVPVTKVSTDDQKWEYLIESEPSLERANEMGSDRWEFAGIYGQSDLGTAVSLTIWKRPLEKE